MVPIDGVNPPKNSAEHNSTRSAPPFSAWIASSIDPQQISNKMFFMNHRLFFTTLAKHFAPFAVKAPDRQVCQIHSLRHVTRYHVSQPSCARFQSSFSLLLSSPKLLPFRPPT